MNMARKDISDFVHGLVSSEKIASNDLDHLSLSELEALMGGAEEAEKLAFGAIACGPSDENWLQQFSYTELYDKAIALAEKELALEREELKQRLARKRTIIDDSLWNKRDQLRLEKDQLVLELHKKKAKDQRKDKPKVASNGDPLREMKARTGKLKKAEEVEYTGQVNNGEPQAPEWPRAALGVDAAGRKATPEELGPQTSVKDPDAQHVEPHSDGEDFAKKVSARSMRLVAKMAGDLSEAARDKLPKKDFALPGQEKFPIPDEAHARNALARAAQFGGPAVQAKVRAKVHKKFPGVELTSASKPEQPTVKKTITKTSAMFGAPLMRVSEIAAHAPKTTSAGLAAVREGMAARASHALPASAVRKAVPPPIPSAAKGGAPILHRAGPQTAGGVAMKAKREADLSAIEEKLMKSSALAKKAIMGGIGGIATRSSGYIGGGVRRAAQAAEGGLARAATSVGKKTITGMPAEGVVSALQHEGVRRATQAAASHPLLGGMAEAGKRMRATAAASPFHVPQAVQPPPLSVLMGH
jgi:hypothetical protein